MKSKLFSLFILSIFLISCSESKEDMLKNLNANKETPSISSIELRDNYENLKDKPVVFEGVVGLGCCGSREIALIDLEDFIQSNGDNIHVALNFSKEELQVVRGFTTGMYIKVVGFVGYKSKSVLWESNYNRGMETSIDLKDCIILSSNSSSNNTSNITTNDNDETSNNSLTYKFNCAPPNGTNRILDKPDTNAIHPAYIESYKGGSSLGTSWSFLGNKMIENSQGKFLYGDIYSPRGGQLNIKENGYNGPVYVYFKDWDCNIEIPK
jgi:hypothetical protein